MALEPMRRMDIAIKRHKPIIIRGILITLAGIIMSHEACFATSNSVRPQLHIVEDADRVNVYIYEDPVFDHTALIRCYRERHDGVSQWQDERADMAQDMGEIWLHQSLLSHPWRVLDPEDAEVYFIPLVCAWFNCGRLALNHQHRMLLRRTVVGINQKLDIWSMWGCGQRMVVVPYTSSSVLTTTEAIGGLAPEKRNIPFTFVGTARERPEGKT